MTANGVALRDPSPEELVRLNRWRISTFWVMLIGYIGYYLIRGNLAVAVPLIAQEYNYSNTELGLIITFSELAYAAGKFTTGPWADSVGGKKVFIIGLAGGIVFNFLFPLHHTIFYFTLIWCVCRYFLSMGWGGIAKTIGEWYEPERIGTMMGAISINFQFGSVAASLFCGWLIALNVGWKGLFYIPAMIAIGILVWSWFASKESPRQVVPGVRFGKNAGQRKAIAAFDADDHKTPPLVIVKSLLKIPLFQQLLTFSFFIHLLRSIFLFWTPKFLVDMGMGNVAAAMSSAIFPFLGCIGTIFLGWYTDHYSKNGDRTRIMAYMLIGLVVSLFAIGFLIPSRSEFQIAMVILLGASGFFMYGPYSMTAGCLSLDIAGSKGAGTCTGMLDGVGYVGGALAAWGAGVMSDRLGWQGVFFVLGLIAIITVAWTFFMSFSYRKRFLHAQATSTS